VFERIWNTRLARFLVIGGVGTGVYWLIFIPAQLWLGPEHVLAWATFASIVNYVLNFFLQRWLTFDHRDAERMTRHAMGYVALYGFLIVLNDVLLHALIDHAHMWWFYAQAIAGILLTAISYPASIVIFRHIPPSAAA
jgi:putative flippase GtrA